MIAAMSNSQIEKKRRILDMRKNHTSYGEVNGEEVEFLRDTGSSVSIVRSALVKPEQYTGKQITCLLVDHCVKTCPQAIVEVDTEFYQGSLPVVCMDRCIYDLIIGNDIYKHGVARYDVEKYKPQKEEVTDIIFENSKLGVGQSCAELGSEMNNEHKELRSTVKAGEKPTTEAEQLISTRSEVTKDISSQSGAVKAEVHSAAVQTRAQKQTETRAPKKLKVKKVEALDISCDEFKLMQKEDEN